MLRAYKYRLYPNKGQIHNLTGMLITLRRLYNTALEQRTVAYQTKKQSVTFTEQSHWLTEIRKTDRWFRQINRNAAQAMLLRLNKSFENFFRRVDQGKKPGYPRFKGRDHFNSIEFLNPNDGYKIRGHKLYIQGVGDLKVKWHRPMEGQLKSVILKREADKWYVAFSCDLGDVAVERSKNPPVGIDLGLSAFLTTSEGAKEANPRLLAGALREIQRLDRKIALKHKQKKPAKREYMKLGSKHREQTKRRRRRLHARVANLRKEHHHQTALKLVRRYGVIAMEELDIQGMLEDQGVPGGSKRHRFARAISDAAWGGFARTLTCKAERAGVSVVKVDPRGTTQGCSGCGAIVPKTIRDRWHDCPSCGLSLDRDHNAALNILRRALPESPAWTGPAGANLGPTPDCPRSVFCSSAVPFKDQPTLPAVIPAKSLKSVILLGVASDTAKLRCMNTSRTRQAKDLRT